MAWVVVSAVVVVMAWAAPGMAKNKSKEEKKADRLWSQIKSHLDRSQELAACRLAVKIAPYPETEAYAAAKSALRQSGISIKDPLMSWTSKAMIKVQNIVENDLRVAGDMKHIGILPDHKDAWGSAIRVEMVELGDYFYLVRSAGADKKYNTGDDPIIGGLKEKRHRGNSGGGEKSNTAGTPGSNKAGGTDSTFKSLLTGKGDTAQSDDRNYDSASELEMDDETRPQEEEIELDDLIKKME